MSLANSLNGLCSNRYKLVCSVKLNFALVAIWRTIFLADLAFSDDVLIVFDRVRSVLEPLSLVVHDVLLEGFSNGWKILGRNDEVTLR